MSGDQGLFVARGTLLEVVMSPPKLDVPLFAGSYILKGTRKTEEQWMRKKLLLITVREMAWGEKHPSAGLEQPHEQEGRGIERGFEGTHRASELLTHPAQHVPQYSGQLLSTMNDSCLTLNYFV